MSSVAAAPVPALTCGHCSMGISPTQRNCRLCGAPLTTTAAASFGPHVASPFADVVPASPARTAAGRGIDAVLVMLAGAFGAVTLGPVGAVLGIALASAVHGSLQSRRGRSLGGLLTRTRTVDAVTGLPLPWATTIARLVRPSARPSPSLFPAEPGPWARAAGCVSADVGRGRDPITPRFAVVPMPTAPAWTDPSAAAVPHGAAVRATLAAAPPDAVVISFTASNAAYWFVDACTIGRSPAAHPGVLPIAVPDLSRTLSTSHVSLLRRDGAVYARDLHSRAGTVIEAPGQPPMALAPGTDARLTVGTTVRMGDHAFRIEAIGEERA